MDNRHNCAVLRDFRGSYAWITSEFVEAAARLAEDEEEDEESTGLADFGLRLCAFASLR